MNDLLRRKIAADTTITRFRGKTGDWAKKVTCLHMAHAHLLNMGYAPPPLPCVRTPTGALRAMKKKGWPNVGAMLDSLGLERIAGAAMLPGDLAVLASPDNEGGVGSILLCAGRLLFGWHEESDVPVMMEPVLPLVSGWRL